MQKCTLFSLCFVPLVIGGLVSCTDEAQPVAGTSSDVKKIYPPYSPQEARNELIRHGIMPQNYEFALNNTVQADDADMVHLLVCAGARVKEQHLQVALEKSHDESLSILITAAKKQNLAVHPLLWSLITRDEHAFKKYVEDSENSELTLEGALELAFWRKECIAWLEDTSVFRSLSPEDALLLAAAGGNVASVERLLSQGATMQPSTLSGEGTFTPLDVAAIMGNSAVLKVLLQQGKCEISPITICRTAELGHVECVNLLLQAGADVNAKQFLAFTPLRMAVGASRSDVVKLLLSAGADVNTRDENDGSTHLHWAASKDAEIAFLLIEAGADINAVNNRGETPLSIACTRGKSDCVRVLLEAGADITPLLNDKDIFVKMAWNCNAECARVLLSLVDPEKLNVPPLLHAVVMNDAQGVQRLLNEGSDANELLYNQLTSLHYAAGYGHKDCLHILLQAGAKVNAANGGGVTPLHAAAGNGHALCVKLLLEAGADINCHDQLGRSPLYWATWYGYSVYEEGMPNVLSRTEILTPQQKEEKLKCIKLLLDAGAL